MPHVIIKLYPGRTREQKDKLADHIIEGIVRIAGCKDSSVSVAIEEVDPQNWADKVYKPDILEYQGTLIKEPGYNPFDDVQPGQDNPGGDLAAYVRQAAKEAENQNQEGYFNAMSWLEMELEDNPDRFDPFFNTAWDVLPDEGKNERAIAIRRVL